MCIRLYCFFLLLYLFADPGISPFYGKLSVVTDTNSKNYREIVYSQGYEKSISQTPEYKYEYDSNGDKIETEEPRSLSEELLDFYPDEASAYQQEVPIEDTEIYRFEPSSNNLDINTGEPVYDDIEKSAKKSGIQQPVKLI